MAVPNEALRVRVVTPPHTARRVPGGTTGHVARPPPNVQGVRAREPSLDAAESVFALTSMFPTFSLGSIFGFPIRVHFSFQASGSAACSRCGLAVSWMGRIQRSFPRLGMTPQISPPIDPVPVDEYPPPVCPIPPCDTGGGGLGG